MYNRLYFKVFILAILGLFTSAFAQQKILHRYMIVHSTPVYTLQFNITYNQSVLELMGTYNDDVRSEYIYSGQTFGADKGYGASAVSKICLDDPGKFRFTQTVGYNRILSYTFGDKNTLADHGKANYNAYTGSLGLEYNFTPAHRFKIYLGADINASIINGKADIWIDDPGHGYQHIGEYTIKNSFRMGYGINIGSEYLVNKDFGLNLGVRLLNLNVLFKKAEGSNTDTEFALRDDNNSGLIFAGRKNFSFYNIMAGVNFYFGITDKRYKLK